MAGIAPPSPPCAVPPLSRGEMDELPESTLLAAQPCAPVGFEYAWAMSDAPAQFFVAEQCADSPMFSAFGYEWCLRVESFVPPDEEPNPYNAYARHLGVWLVLLTSDAHVRVSLTLSVGNRARHLREVSLCTYTAEVRAAEDVLDDEGERAGCTDLVACQTAVSSPDTYFPDGKLTVKVLLRACDVPRCSPVAVQLPRLSEQWGELLASGRGADVTLVCTADDVKLAAHTLVLSVRSPVFAVKFGPDGSWTTATPDTQVMVPSEISSHAMKRLLEFLYTDKLEPTSAEEAQHLLHAAAYYDVPRLREICEMKLIAAINTENAAFTLLLAAKHGAKMLKDNTLCWIAQRIGWVMGTEGWQQLEDSEAGKGLMHDVLHTIGRRGPPVSARDDSFEVAGDGDAAAGSKRPRE